MTDLSVALVEEDEVEGERERGSGTVAGEPGRLGGNAGGGEKDLGRLKYIPPGIVASLFDLATRVIGIGDVDRARCPPLNLRFPPKTNEAKEGAFNDTTSGSTFLAVPFVDCSGERGRSRGEASEMKDVGEVEKFSATAGAGANLRYEG